ncbi:MAG: PKD domain-containing protein [Flavobacterium sp.]|nr:PKD domain-containing protein [Flavobacterium sp.]
MLALFTSGLFFGQANYSLSWDINVGCQISLPPKGHDADVLYLEDIQSTPCIEVCEGSAITYKLTGNLLPSSNVQWQVSGGSTSPLTTTNTSTFSSTQVSWGTSGSGTVTFSMNSPTGGIITKSLCITIIKKPLAFFDVGTGLVPVWDAPQEIHACVNQNIDFFDYSTTNGGSAIVSHYWSFGDGTSTQDQNPSHTYGVTGIYNVSLTITNLCGCTSTFRAIARIKRVAGYELTCARMVCEGQTATYSLPPDAIQACVGDYDFIAIGGNLTNPQNGTVSVIWNDVDQSGFGVVTFEPNNLCNMECLLPTSIRIPVMQSRGTIIGDNKICMGSQGIYRLPKWPSTEFSWSVVGATVINPIANLLNTDQPNEIAVQPLQTGTITLVCTYINTFLKCGGRATYTIDVASPQNISGPVNLCVNTAGTYSVTSGNIVNWTITKDGSIVYNASVSNSNNYNYNFTSAGSYSLTVSGSNVCDNQTININVNPIPSPVLLSQIAIPTGVTNNVVPTNSFCPNAPYTFNIINPNPAMDYIWAITGGNFIGGNIANEVTVSFNLTGPYLLTVSQRIKGQPTCTSTPFSIPINIFNINAVITDNSNFALNPNIITQCANNEKTYYAINTLGGSLYGAGDTYAWTITPSYLGSVTLGQGTNTAKILWNNITTANAQATITVQITKCSRDSGTTINRSITLVPQRTLTLSANSVCSGTDITLTLTSNLLLPTGTQIEWNYGDGGMEIQTISTPATTATITYVYFTNPTGTGSFTVKAKILNPSGSCTGSVVVNKIVNIIPGPQAEISMSGNLTPCETADIDVYMYSTSTNNSVIKWYRQPNVLIATTGSIHITPTTGPGNYYFTSTLNGCTSKSDNIAVQVSNCNIPTPCYITPYPYIDYVNNTNCNTLAVTATTTELPLSGYPSLWTVIGPDPATNVTDVPRSGADYYNYTTSINAVGLYHIAVKMKYICNGNTLIDHSKKNNQGQIVMFDIVVPFLADFNTSVNCPVAPNTGYTVSLTSTSAFMFNIQNSDRRYTYYYSNSNAGPWTQIGTSNTAPTAIFTPPAGTTNFNFYFKLVVNHRIAQFAPSCEKISNLVNLAPDPVQTITYTPLICADSPSRFSLFPSNNSDTNYLWTFDTQSGVTPLATNTLLSPSRVFDELPNGQAHPVVVTVKITNRFGCERTLTTTTLPVQPVVPAHCFYGNIAASNTNICSGGSLTLSYVAGTIPDNCTPTTYLWMDGSQQIASTSSSTYTINNVTGTPFYWVRVLNGNCIYYCTGRITPTFKAKPTLTLSAPYNICSGSAEFATATVGAGTTVAWSVDNVLINNTNLSTLTKFWCRYAQLVRYSNTNRIRLYQNHFARICNYQSAWQPNSKLQRRLHKLSGNSNSSASSRWNRHTNLDNRHSRQPSLHQPRWSLHGYLQRRFGLQNRSPTRCAQQPEQVFVDSTQRLLHRMF